MAEYVAGQPVCVNLTGAQRVAHQGTEEDVLPHSAQPEWHAGTVRDRQPNGLYRVAVDATWADGSEASMVLVRPQGLRPRQVGETCK